MKKSYLIAVAAFCTLAISSCDTPSDYRPGRKVSVDYVPPGERRTYNVSDLGDDAPVTEAGHGHGTPEGHGVREHDEQPSHIQLGRDPGANEINDSLATPESSLINEEEAATNH